jgi:hypothetical protein
MWKDYDLENPSTWVPMEAPTVDPSWVNDLTRIGGLNRFGQPNLVWRWGATHRDPMALDNGLKYWLMTKDPELQGFEFTDPVTKMLLRVKKMEDVPPTVIIAEPKYEAVQLGERRIIVEQWRSPEFLARSSRYLPHMLRDPDTVKQFFFCKACQAPLTMQYDVSGGAATPRGPGKCAQCGSSRSYMCEARFEGDGKLLREFPEHGCYDFFLRLENSLGEPMEADGHALGWIERLWHEQHTKTQREKIADMLAETADQEALNRAANSPVNPFVAPALPGR